MLQTTLVVDDTTTIANGQTYSGDIFAARSDQTDYTRTVKLDGSLSDVEGGQNLHWTRFGAWSLEYPGDWFSTNGGRYDSVFIVGYVTPSASMPTSGTATYTGVAQGTVYTSSQQADLTGSASLSADFANQQLTGTLTGMTADGAPWNNVGFTSTILGNSFSGDARATNAPGGPYSLAGSATGTLQGNFFGPVAQEAGAVWTLFDGSTAAIGTLTGGRP